MSGVRFTKPYERTDVTEVFYGINKGERIPDGYFSDMTNMTSSSYPCLAVRSERKNIYYADGYMSPGNPQCAVIFEDSLVTACSNGLISYKDKEIDAVLPVSEMVIFGKRFFVAPSGCFVDSEGNREFAGNVVCGSLSVKFCNSSFEDIVIESVKPSAPSENAYWFNSENKGVYRYDSAGKEWISVPSLYMKFEGDSVDFSSFREGDGVRLCFSASVPTSATEETAPESDEYVDTVVMSVSESSIVLEGIFEYFLATDISAAKNLKIERRYPQIQHIVSHNNRIWGCCCNGELNEIYASKLGDPLNWYCYRGLSTDSYAVSCGEYGEFTGCAEVGDTVVFFKENCIYTVYGSEPSNFQTVKTDCFGVQKGSEKSICKINGSVYYKSCHGIMRMNESSLPVCISDQLGSDVWSDAVAGTDGRKYYISMTDIKGNRSMYVFDTKTELWHKEDVPCDGHFCFVTFKNNLLAIGKSETTIKAKPSRLDIMSLEDAKPKKEDYYIGGTFNSALYFAAFLTWKVKVYHFTNSNKRMLSDEQLRQILAEEKGVSVENITDEELDEYRKGLFYYKDSYCHEIKMSYLSNELTCNAFQPFEYESPVQEDEGRFHWEAVTGIRGFSLSENKRLKSLEVRMKIYPGARCDVSIMYDDDGRFENIATFDTAGMRTYRMNGRLNKCDSYRLRFSGYGKVVIFSIGETYEEAGNIGF